MNFTKVCMPFVLSSFETISNVRERFAGKAFQQKELRELVLHASFYVLLATFLQNRSYQCKKCLNVTPLGVALYCSVIPRVALIGKKLFFKDGWSHANAAMGKLFLRNGEVDEDEDDGKEPSILPYINLGNQYIKQVNNWIELGNDFFSSKSNNVKMTSIKELSADEEGGTKIVSICKIAEETFKGLSIVAIAYAAEWCARGCLLSVVSFCIPSIGKAGEWQETHSSTLFLPNLVWLGFEVGVIQSFMTGYLKKNNVKNPKKIMGQVFNIAQLVMVVSAGFLLIKGSSKS